jgi:hypothetical protein
MLCAVREQITNPKGLLVDNGAILFQSLGARRRLDENDGRHSAALAIGAVREDHAPDGSCNLGEEFLHAGRPGQSRAFEIS